MSTLAQFPAQNTAPQQPHDSSSEKIADAIKTLFALLPIEDQDVVLKALRPIAAPRAGDVLGAIIRLLPQRRNWTVEELKTGVTNHGVEATSKEIYNAIGYLTRKKHIQRVAYGQYIVDGLAVVTSEEIGGTPTQHDDGHRID